MDEESESVYKRYIGTECGLKECLPPGCGGWGRMEGGGWAKWIQGKRLGKLFPGKKESEFSLGLAGGGIDE